MKLNSASDISKTANILDNGGIIILPTETVYGIGARADIMTSISKIYTIKNRIANKPIAVCVKDVEQAEIYAKFSDKAKMLAQKFWPGPLSLILPATDNRLSPLCYADDFIALRCPDISWRDTLCETPLALTSANKSGEPDATTANTSLNDTVDAVIDFGPTREGLPSTIVKLDGETVTVLREGALKSDSLGIKLS